MISMRWLADPNQDQSVTFLMTFRAHVNNIILFIIEVKNLVLIKWSNRSVVSRKYVVC